MKYLIPFVYGFSTRANTMFYKISFFIVVFFPILIVTIFGNGDIRYCIPRFIIAFIALYSVYEIGYIFNDTYTVRFEKNPTYRLNQIERHKVERLANLLISVRIFTVILCIILLNHLGILNLTLFIIMLGLLDVSYAFHNYFRSEFNIITIFFVLVFKYISIPILFIPINNYLLYCSILIIIVPVLRTIEFAGKKEYSIKLFKKFQPDSFRVWYYLILTSTFFILRIFDKKYNVALLLASYFLIFRIISVIALKSKKIGVKITKTRNNIAEK